MKASGTGNAVYTYTPPPDVISPTKAERAALATKALEARRAKRDAEMAGHDEGREDDFDYIPSPPPSSSRHNDKNNNRRMMVMKRPKLMDRMRMSNGKTAPPGGFSWD